MEILWGLHGKFTIYLGLFIFIRGKKILFDIGEKPDASKDVQLYTKEEEMIILFEEERAAFDRMIELIHQFQGGTAFLLWLSEGQLVTKGAYAKRSEDRFEKVGEYWIDNLKVFFGGAHFYLNCVEKSFIKNIVDREYEYKSLVSEFSKMKKKVIYDLLIGHTYTVIYQFHYAGKLCASCWTIYDMKNLLQVCKNRNVNFFT